jgi:hypothetical protein
MTTETKFEAGADSASPSAPQVQLEFGTVVRRVVILAMLVQVARFWRRRQVNRRWIRHPRTFGLLLARSPFMLVIASVIGLLTAGVGYLLVRFVVQPLVWLWYNPRIDTAADSFYLSANEVVEDSLPARRAIGRRWQAGTLARTNQRLWFFPLSWDAEPWSATLGPELQLRSEPAPSMGLGAVTGLPDLVCVQDAAGKTERFAVAEPDAVLSWVGPCPQSPAKGA